MDIYIDKECLFNILSAPKESRDKYLHLLKYNLNKRFTFSKEDIANHHLLNIFSLLFTSGIGDSTIDFDTIYKTFRPLNINDLDPCSVHLLECEDNFVQSHRNKIIIGNQNNTLSSLEKLFLHEIHNYNITIDINRFEWSFVVDLIYPCTDIIITDRYLFSENNNNFRRNIFHFFQLIANININHKLNIVFFSGKYDRNKLEQIKNIFSTTPNITHVQYTQQHNPHDRCIITNYKIFKSGDSFSNLHNRNGFSFDIASLAKCDEFNVSQNIINSLQNIINSNTIINGDKVSNILHF